MKQQTRFYGLDIIRLISFLAIAVFHISVIHFHSDHLDIGDRSVIIFGIESFARSISFSGFTILFLSSLLTGLSGSNLAKRMKLFAFLFIGWIALCFLIHAKVNFLTTWDIYLLILLGLSTASVAEHCGKKTVRFLTVLGFVLLWIPFWEIGDFVENSFGLSIPWQSVLGFANCPISFSEWPLLPWMGLIWFGYGIGFEIKEIWQNESTESLRITKSESTVWLVLLACSTINWGVSSRDGPLDSSSFSAWLFSSPLAFGDCEFELGESEAFGLVPDTLDRFDESLPQERIKSVKESKSFIIFNTF